MTKNWTGNSNSIYKTLGASNHTDKEREPMDFYATDPKAAELLLKLEDFDCILEPACGSGHLSKVFVQAGKRVKSSDIADRGYGEIKSFFDYTSWIGDIITNPPYNYAQEFVEHALQIVLEDSKVAMFLKLQFLEGKNRGKMFKRLPPKIIYVSSSRIMCAKNAEFERMKAGGGSAVAYGWFVWVKGFTGNTTIKWFN